MIEIDGAHLVGADGVDVRALAVDMTGQVRDTGRFTGRLQSTVSGEDTRRVRVALSLGLPPGRHQLRVAVARSDERAAGSVFDEIEVPDFRKGLALGGLVLGTAGSSGAAGLDRILRDLHLVPIATQELPAQMVLRAGLALQVSSTHRSGTLLLVATLTSSAGEKRELIRVERPAAAFTGGGSFDFDLPLRGLRLGEYQLRADVSLGKLSAHRETSFRVLPVP